MLYLLHGNNGDANDWLTQGHLQNAADALIERKDIPPVAIVMPQGGTDWYVDRKEHMETAFFNDLLPEIEAHYAVSTQRGGRMIGGVSMGGFGALRYVLTRPELFCGALLLSPAIYANEPPRASAARHVGVFGDRQFDPQVWHELNYPAQWDHYMSRPYRVPMFIASATTTCQSRRTHRSCTRIFGWPAIRRRCASSRAATAGTSGARCCPPL